MKSTKYTALLAAVFTLSMVGLSLAGNNGISDPTTDKLRYRFTASSNTNLAISATGQLCMQEGITNKHETFPNVVFSSNGILNQQLSTGTLVRQGTTYVAIDMTQPSSPIGLTLTMWRNTETSTLTFITTATITGVSARGEVIRETVRVTTNIARTNNAFISISSITYSLMTTSFPTVNTENMYLVVGTTSTFGLSGHPYIADNVYKTRANWSVGGVSVTSVTVNTTFDTMVFDPKSSGVGPFETWYRDTTSPPVRINRVQN